MIDIRQRLIGGPNDGETVVVCRPNVRTIVLNGATYDRSANLGSFIFRPTRKDGIDEQ